MNGANIMKPSKVIEAIDKYAEIKNCYIDMQNSRIKGEVKFLYDNYKNISVLRQYFLRLYDIGNYITTVKYVQYLSHLSDEEIQHMAEYRANYLYCQLLNNTNNKINNMPLKKIEEILKLLNK